MVKSAQKATSTEFVRDIDSNVYLFRKGKGSLVLPADDELTPVLGESESGDFTLELPPSYENWLATYSGEINAFQNTPVLIEDGAEEERQPKESGEQTGAAGEPRKSIPYMVKTTWSQKYPFNAHLDFGDGRCVVGCTAVMIGQIMHHWYTKGYKRGCTATTSYQWKGEKYKVKALPPITVFDYDHLTTGIPKTEEEIEAVATMLEYIGKAVKSNYGVDGTTAYSNIWPPLMISRLRLGSTIKVVNAAKVGIAAFTDAIYKELLEGRPVGMWGTNDSGSGCHAFVCDGYNAATDKFHMNWGWGGSYNGWYAMTALNITKTVNYNDRQNAVTGIMPEYKLGDANRDGIVSITDAMVAIDHSLKGTYDEASDVNGDNEVNAADGSRIISHILGKEKL